MDTPALAAGWHQVLSLKPPPPVPHHLPLRLQLKHHLMRRVKIPHTAELPEVACNYSRSVLGYLAFMHTLLATPPHPPTLPCPCLSSDIPGPMQCLELVVAASLSPAGSASDSPGGAAHAPQGPACTHPNLSMFKSWDHFCLPLRSLITPCADLHTTPKRRYVLTLAVLLYADWLLTTCRVSGQQCKA